MTQPLQLCAPARPPPSGWPQEEDLRESAWRQEAGRWLKPLATTTGIGFRLSSTKSAPIADGCQFCRMMWKATSGQQAVRPAGCSESHWQLERAAREAGAPVLRTCRGGLQLYAMASSSTFGEGSSIECGPFLRDASAVGSFSGRLSRLPLRPDQQAELIDASSELPSLGEDRIEALREILLCLVRGVTASASVATPPVNAREPVSIGSARRFIAEHAATENLTLGLVARHVSLSEDYFSKLFQRETGLAFTDYLNRLRVDRVRHLLVTTPAGVAELALASGFGSVPHFNRIFRRFTGQSPTDYRRTAQQPEPAPAGTGVRAGQSLQTGVFGFPQFPNAHRSRAANCI